MDCRITIKDENNEEIKKALESVQTKRMTARTLDVHLIHHAASQAEREYLELGFTKKAMPGQQYWYGIAETPGIFRGKRVPKTSTMALIEKGTQNKWILVKIERREAEPSEVGPVITKEEGLYTLARMWERARVSSESTDPYQILQHEYKKYLASQLKIEDLPQYIDHEELGDAVRKRIKNLS